MGQKARYVLPEVVEPSTSVCYMVPVPNDPQHIAAFMGAIFGLSKPYEWQNDPAHTAIDVGAVWLNIFNNLEQCSGMTLYRQIDSCILEASNDGGSTWEVIFDASSCVREGIVDAIQDGTISGGGSQPPGGSGTSGQCYRYTVSIAGDSKWIAPIPVENGDSIQVISATGAWYNGAASPVGVWNCPDGKVYALGVCGGTPTSLPDDPVPSIGTMRLIGFLDDASPQYFDMYEQTHIVDSVAGPTQFFLQANDDPLSDNEGSITVVVEICKGQWCYDVDFSVSNGGWSTHPRAGEPGCNGSYVSGSGWSSAGCQPGGTFQRVSIGNNSLDLSGSVVKTFEYWTTGATSGTSCYVHGFGGTIQDAGACGAFSNPQHVTIGGLNLTGDDVDWLTLDSNSGAPLVITRVKISGVGPHPSWETGC